jgi:hypothetical protein
MKRLFVRFGNEDRSIAWTVLARTRALGGLLLFTAVLAPIASAQNCASKLPEWLVNPGASVYDRVKQYQQDVAEVTDCVNRNLARMQPQIERLNKEEYQRQQEFYRKLREWVASQPGSGSPDASYYQSLINIQNAMATMEASREAQKARMDADETISKVDSYWWKQ